ncbi:hypothetical protein ETD86_10995 [Nonomuraea turkmeniaca]|uniref:Uncharacterized protein n=1 Tax=Nonomuraea turkmeniaca TaxID=103838 RepID=A0A5S4G9I1_9ACTN|nr:hypothetical protein [Nonomuraea turkmeniaca]TMR22650.1 hypothetical protein ETD86_10995 [Nonomuraea turkmeniaca]
MTTSPSPVPTPQATPDRPTADPHPRTDTTPAPPSLTPPPVAEPPDWNYSGIDPNLMHDFERDLGQAETTLGRSEPHIRRILQDLDLDTSRLNAIRELGNWIGAKRPELRRRNETIQAVTTKWGTDTTGGKRPFDEALYTRASGDPDAYAAALKLGEVSPTGKVDEKTIAELEKRAGDPQFATSLMYALGTQRFRHLMAALAYPKDASKKRLQAALGKALGAASSRLNKSWQKELLSNLRVPVDQHGLANLLPHGKFNKDFLISVAVTLEAIDRKTWKDGPENPEDPMVGAWKALAKHPRAAQEFLIFNPGVLQRFVAERPMYDSGKSFGQALEAATMTYRDRDGTPQERSPGFYSAKLVTNLINLQGQLYLEEKPVHVPIATNTRILTAYMNDVTRIARTPSRGDSEVFTADRPNLPPEDQVWGAAFNRDHMRRVMSRAFQHDPKALATLTTAQTAWAKKMLDYGAAQAAAGKGRNALLVNAREAAAGFGLIADASGIAKIKAGKEQDAAQERNMKLFMAAVNTGLGIPQAAPWAIAANILGSWTSLIEETAKTEKNANKGAHEANTGKDKAEFLVEQLTIDAMLRHGLFGKSDPPAPTHPWSSLEDLDEGDDPRKSPNNFLKDGGSSLMTPKEMAPYPGDVQPRLDAFDRWLREGFAGKQWEELEETLKDGIRDGASGFKES